MQMRVFHRFRALREFEQQHLGFVETLEDYNLIREIGFAQVRGAPLKLKELFLLGAGSVATVQRRLQRLRGLGAVQQRKSPTDRRAIELTLSPKCVKAFRKFELVLSPEQSIGTAGHSCGLYQDDAGRRKLALPFFIAGVRKGETCLLVANAEVREELFAGLGEKRRGVLFSEGESTADAQIGFLKEHFVHAKRTGRRLRLVGDMAWTLRKGLALDGLLRLEARADVLARQFPVSAMCLYDARHFTSPVIVKALKCHRDTAQFPLPVA